MVRIDSGPLSATDSFRDVCKDRWRQLVIKKRHFIATTIEYDCRCLLEFVDEAAIAWEFLGYNSPEDMIRKGYELEPQEIELAVAWLKLNSPDEPVGIATIQTKIAEAKAKPLAEKAGAPEGNRNAKRDDENNVDNINIERPSGTSAEYLLRRLARDNPEILDELEAGKIKSVRQAAIAAGIVKVKNADEKAVEAVRKAENVTVVAKALWDRCDSQERAMVRLVWENLEQE